MDPAGIIAILVALGTLVAIGVVLANQGHPETSASHEHAGNRDEGPTDEPYPPGARPAGPGAEGMHPAEPGEIVPGRPAGSTQPPRE